MAEKTRKPMILDLHIPYCVRPERFQNRYFAVGSNEEKNAYLAALKKEILSYEGDLDEYEIRAVTLSGGSATVMSPDRLGDLLRTVREKLPVSKGVEISVDAHPLTICTPALTGIASGHPNRMELIIHSDNQQELETLGCSFTEQHIQNAILFFKRFHMNNVGMTISYGIPGQTLHSWMQTLRACSIIHPAHMTIQALHAEKEAPVNGPSETERRNMYKDACRFLSENGYLQYSATHFALPHHGWLYQLLMMEGASCLGMGVGAKSFYDGYVVRNTNNLKRYISNAGDYEKITAQVSEADDETAMQRYVSLRLTSTDGLSRDAFRERFGHDLPPKIEEAMEKAALEGLLTIADGVFRPTPDGMYDSFSPSSPSSQYL